MRLKYFIISSLIFLGCLSEAKIYLWPVIAKARGERNEDQNLELRSNQLPSFGGAYTFERFIFGLDFSRYESGSDSGNVAIDTSYSDVVLSAGYSLFSGEIWDFYALAAVGLYEQKVETSINNLSTDNTSSNKNLVGFGAEYVIQTPFIFATTVGGRFNWTEDLDPELMPEMYLKLGVGF